MDSQVALQHLPHILNDVKNLCDFHYIYSKKLNRTSRDLDIPFQNSKIIFLGCIYQQEIFVKMSLATFLNKSKKKLMFHYDGTNALEKSELFFL